MQLVDRVEIPSGCTHTFTICGVTLEVALVLVGLLGVSWIVLHHVWALLGLIPLWLFLRYHSKKEPLFLKFWTGQLLCRPYYHS
jgi:type IV secretory pathway VirB3-like protein